MCGNIIKQRAASSGGLFEGIETIKACVDISSGDVNDAGNGRGISRFRSEQQTVRMGKWTLRIGTLDGALSGDRALLDIALSNRNVGLAIFLQTMAANST